MIRMKKKGLNHLTDSTIFYNKINHYISNRRKILKDLQKYFHKEVQLRNSLGQL